MTTRTAPTLTLTAEPGLPFIDTERVLDAPRDLVFRCFAEPELLRQWLGPKGYEMRVETYDFRPGGSWRYIHLAPDGTEYAFNGVFHGEQTPHVMLQTFEFEGAPGHVALDRITLEDLGDGRTTARTHSAYQSVLARDAMIANGMEHGMADGYERLDELVARLRAN